MEHLVARAEPTLDGVCLIRRAAYERIRAQRHCGHERRVRHGERVVGRNGLHISEAEAASDFAVLMARVRADAKVIIENGARPVAVLHAAEPVRRSISECIALAKAHEDETGIAPVLDPDFAEDVEAILSHRKPWNPPAWE